MSSQANIEHIPSQQDIESMPSPTAEDVSFQTNIESEDSGSKSKTKTSWIWQYFKENKIERNNEEVNVIICQVMIDDDICGTTYVNSGGSTGNAINHLYLRHNIAKTGKTNKVDLTFLQFKII